MVVGASGAVGIATVKSLAAVYGSQYTIKAGVRDVSSSKNASLLEKGVKLVTADMSKPATLVPALNGVKVAFIVAPGHKNRAAMVAQVVQASKQALVGHIVILSACCVKPGTIFADQFIEIEDCAMKSGMSYTIVRLPMFMESVLTHLESIASSQKFYTALESNAIQNCVSLDDAGEAIAKIMAFPQNYRNKILRLGGNAVTEEDFALAFSHALETPIKHVMVSYLDSKAQMMRMGVPGWQVDGTIELLTLINEKEPSLSTADSDLPFILDRPLATPAGIVAKVSQELKRLAATARLVAEQQRAEMEKSKAAALEAKAALVTAEQEAEERARARAIANHVAETRRKMNDGSLVLKKMGNETGFKHRFVWIDDDDKKLCWSKSETKDGLFKSIILQPTVRLSAPVYSAAKPAGMFGVPEPEGFVFSLTEKAGAETSVDLKVEGTIEDAFAWINSLKVLCGHIARVRRGSIAAEEVVSNSKRVFCLSGWGKLPDGLYWPQLIPYLEAAGHTVIKATEPCEDGNIDVHVGNLEALVKAHGGLDGNCFFIGQSVGAQIIMRYLARRKENVTVAGMVAIGGWLELVGSNLAMKPWCNYTTINTANLQTVCPNLMVLMSTDDTIVGLNEQYESSWRSNMPFASLRIAHNRGHYLVEELTVEELQAISNTITPPFA